MLYRGTNKSNNCKWIIADDENEALDIAVKNGLVKKRENCRLQTSDKYCDDFYKSFKDRGNDMTEVDTKKGIGGCYFNSKPNDKGTWKVEMI